MKMKRVIAFLMALTLVFCMSVSAFASGYNYDGLSGYVLKNGYTGNNVRNLQKALIDWGYLPAGSADGAFGDKTEAAVKEFQRKNGFAGEIGYAGVGTMFTQAALFSNDIYGANSPYKLTNNASGEYGVRNCSLKYSTSLDAKFTFVNKDPSKTVEAICVYWWMADSNNNLVDIKGYDYWMSWTYDLSVGPGQTKDISYSLDPTSRELNKACTLRFIVGEIAYKSGEVYITYNASKDPYRNANYIVGEW